MVRAQPFVIDPARAAVLLEPRRSGWRCRCICARSSSAPWSATASWRGGGRRLSHLTEFYLWLAVGGMLGGAVRGAARAARCSTGCWEYPLALVAACLLRPGCVRGPRRRRCAATWRLPIAVMVLILLRARLAARSACPELGSGAALLLLVPAALLLYGMAERPLRFGLGMAAALGAGLLGADAGPGAGARAELLRRLYGQARPGRLSRPGRTAPRSTAPSTSSPTGAREPLTYYLRATGRSASCSRRSSGRPPQTVGAVGLGVGTVACYRRPGPALDLLRDRPAGRADRARPPLLPLPRGLRAGRRRSCWAMRAGRCSEAPRGHYDLLILDAFSSDAIPVHLLTREALALYLDKLAPGGADRAPRLEPQPRPRADRGRPGGRRRRGRPGCQSTRSRAQAQQCRYRSAFDLGRDRAPSGRICRRAGRRSRAGQRLEAAARSAAPGPTPSPTSSARCAGGSDAKPLKPLRRAPIVREASFQPIGAPAAPERGSRRSAQQAERVDGEPALHLLPPDPGARLAPGPCRLPGRDLRARARQGGLLRPRDPHVPQPSADRLGRLGGAAPAALLRPQPDRGRRRLALGRGRGAAQQPRPARLLAGADEDGPSGAQWRRRPAALRPRGRGRPVLRLRPPRVPGRRLHGPAAQHDVADRMRDPGQRALDRGDRRLADAAGQGHGRPARDLRSRDAGRAADRRGVPRPAGRA